MIRARLALLKFRLLRLRLGLKIAVQARQCRRLGIEEPKALREDRRRAAFVDQFFERSKRWRRAG
ncbi:hypothetical protein EAT51_07865 [Pseudoxanthomonas winnipegensis]|uniref:hypothetical protein n=1 Tax=Pseudoxanthomonas winnipegensis TaxID=2480810 RepID=UPI00102DEEEF|nr:hypothetical protein [Pseudoxanthomonas winnipegensis]RZZ81958.1 hypothetical protein EA662_17460 [Pseudoxanthomonas winnipegensis]TAA42176.1 hypothetical protein EAT51_07865 [Pseudoxanthomonas winnipegensis]